MLQDMFNGIHKSHKMKCLQFNHILTVGSFFKMLSWRIVITMSIFCSLGNLNKTRTKYHLIESDEDHLQQIVSKHERPPVENNRSIKINGVTLIRYWGESDESFVKRFLKAKKRGKHKKKGKKNGKDSKTHKGKKEKHKNKRKINEKHSKTHKGKKGKHKLAWENI